MIVPKTSSRRNRRNAEKKEPEGMKIAVPETLVYGTIEGMKVAIYSRVSTLDGRQDAENQLHQLREFCQRQGAEIVAEFVDHASGKTAAKRPQFQAMMEAAGRREFDLLLFWSLDRLSREGVLETLQHLQRLNGFGVNWQSLTESYLSSLGPFKDAVLAILASIAKQERIRISERTIAGLQRAKRQGKKLGRPRVVCDRAKIRAAHERGMSLAAVAAEFGISKTSAARICA
jgi:DNA invertase Pin-like site-specific DNA recombinase